MSPFTVKRYGIVHHFPVERSTEVKAVFPTVRAHNPKVVIRRNGEIIRKVG